MKKDHPYYHEGMWKGAPSENFGKAKVLRKNMTPAETLLWEKLKNPPFSEFKFRRQHPIQNYIADFYSHSLKLIIEVDGEYHEDSKQVRLDSERTEVLEFNGLDVIRFTNEDVLKNIPAVLIAIKEKINSSQK